MEEKVVKGKKTWWNGIDWHRSQNSKMTASDSQVGVQSKWIICKCFVGLKAKRVCFMPDWNLTRGGSTGHECKETIG